MSVNPEMLAWARKRSGFTIESLAEKIGKSPEEIIKWENGSKSPSYTNLEKLAYTYFKVPLAIFLLSEPPDIEDPINNFRRLSDYELERISPDTIHKIIAGHAYQETLTELAPRNTATRSIIKEIDSKGLSVKQLAQKVRDCLGVSIQNQFDFQDAKKAFKQWRYFLEKRGVFTFKDSFKDSYISGFSLLHEEFPIIFINNSNSFSRQIFTLIHELGHILYGIYGITDLDETYLNFMTSADKKLEIKCNCFAAEFLVPASEFRKDISNYKNHDDDTISELAQKYSVSREFILRRLLDSNVVSQAFYSSKSSEWNQDYLRRYKQKSGGNYYLTKLSYLGEGFTKLIYEHYNSGRLTPSELAGHLNIKARNIDKLSDYLRW